MKILILASTGLLGNTITKYFFNNTKFQTYGTLRDSSNIKFFDKKYKQNFLIIKNILNYSETENKLKNLKPDIIINCFGITNKEITNGRQSEDFININSLFPYRLQKICSNIGARLIHFSSDCIYSGNKGSYNEYDNPDPTDIYGRSKLLGELDFDNTLTIRKSVIGHELLSKKGLLEWFLQQENYVQGYKNVIFSGITVLELAILIEKYIIPRKNLKGIINISGERISKYELLKIIANVYKKPIKIIPNNSLKIDRSLDGSQFNKLTGYKSNSWSLLIKSMYEFNLLNK